MNESDNVCDSQNSQSSSGSPFLLPSREKNEVWEMRGSLHANSCKRRRLLRVNISSMEDREGELMRVASVIAPCEGTGNVGISDERLAEAARQGDKKAFATLALRYRPVAFAYAYAIFRDRDEAEDAVQEGFVRAYQNLPRFQNSEKWGAWLLQIVRNYCHDRIRRRKIRAVLPLLEEWIDHSPTPEMQTLSKERSRELALAVESLPEKNRILIMMHYGAGLSYEEMATAIGAPRTTIVGRMSAALRILRRRFKGSELL